MVIPLPPGTHQLNLEPDTVSINGASWSNFTNEGVIPVSITLSDRLGNTSVAYTNASGVIDEYVTYYPADATGVTYLNAVLTADDPLIGWADEEDWVRGDEPMTLTFSSGARDIQSLSNVQIESLAAVGSGMNYTQTRNDALAEGTELTVTADVVDMAGNPLSYSEDSGIYYDNDDPDDSSYGLAISTRPDSSTIYVNSSMASSGITLDLSSLDTNLYGYSFKVFGGAYGSIDPLGGSTTDSTTLATSGTLSSQDDGSKTGTVKFYDKAGNFAEKPFSFILDTAPTDHRCQQFCQY